MCASCASCVCLRPAPPRPTACRPAACRPATPRPHRLQAHLLKTHDAPLDVNSVELHGNTALVESARNGDAAVRSWHMH